MEGRGEMMQPHKCPICEGRGNVPDGFYSGDPNPVFAPEECKACNGTGILWGSDFSIDVQAPDPEIYGDGNTTPPFTITWENPIDLDNIPLKEDDRRTKEDRAIAQFFFGDIT